MLYVNKCCKKKPFFNKTAHLSHYGIHTFNFMTSMMILPQKEILEQITGKKALYGPAFPFYSCDKIIIKTIKLA